MRRRPLARFLLMSLILLVPAAAGLTPDGRADDARHLAAMDDLPPLAVDPVDAAPGSAQPQSGGDTDGAASTKGATQTEPAIEEDRLVASDNAIPQTAAPAPGAPSALPRGMARDGGATAKQVAPESKPMTDATPQPVYMDSHARIQTVCAEPGPTGILDPGGPIIVGDTSILPGCPRRVYDGGDAFANPTLAVHPLDPTQAAFFSLHGSLARNGPSEWSRTGQTHTTFTTNDQGAGNWQDQPISPDGDLMGEWPAGVMDDTGNIYVGYLWSSAAGPDTYDYEIGLFKAATARESGGVRESYDDPFSIEQRQDNGSRHTIHELYLAYVQPEEVDDEPEPAGNATGNSTGEALGEGEDGNLTFDLNRTDYVVAAWLETAQEPGNSSMRYAGFIDFAFTETGGRNNWTRLNETQIIGPCKDYSNIEAWDGLVYVACNVAKGYDHRPRARIGDIDVWSFDPTTGETELLGTTGLNGGRPRLAIADDGYMGIVTSRWHSMQQVEVRMAAGWYGYQWEPLPGDLGGRLHTWLGGHDMWDADVTAVEMTRDHVIWISYKEWNNRTQDNLPEPDPSDPSNLDGVRLVDFRKMVFATDMCSGPIAGVEMQLGTQVDAYNYDIYSQDPGAFNDHQDGLHRAIDPLTGQEFLYFAVNDYGAMQFGAMYLEGQPGFCPPPPPPLNPGILPVPQALSVASPNTAIIGSAFGVASVAAITYLLAVKRRNPIAAVAEDR